jgi:hypothetical protein
MMIARSVFAHRGQAMNARLLSGFYHAARAAERKVGVA